MHLLVKKTFGIRHCHLKVFIGPSKVTSNSHSLMRDERFLIKSENRIQSINFSPLVWCQHRQKRTWHHFLDWKVQVSGADMVGKSIVFVRWKYSLEILWEGFLLKILGTSTYSILQCSWSVVSFEESWSSGQGWKSRWGWRRTECHQSFLQSKQSRSLSLSVLRRMGSGAYSGCEEGTIPFHSIPKSRFQFWDVRRLL